MDHYYVFSNFSRAEFGLMLNGVMSALQHTAGRHWVPDDYRRYVDLADKIKSVTAKLDKSQEVNAEELQNLVRRGMAVAYLHKETHGKANESYLPAIVD